MSSAEYKLTEFQDFLAKTELIESSRRQVILATRRALKHLGPERLCDRNELLLYRLSMPEATRRLFGYAWSKFQPYMASLGQPLPDLPKMPSFSVVHPLWADLTDLSIRVNVSLMPGMRWQDLYDGRISVFGGSDAVETVEKAARRAFEYVTGREPMDIDWLIPRDSSAQTPMPDWMIETILRTNVTERDKPVEQAAFDLLQQATRRGISAADLRTLWSAVTEAFETAAGRRRVDRLGAVVIDSDGPWGPEDQKLVMSILGGTVLKEIPVEKKLDISGAVIALRDAMNRATVTS